MKPIPIKTKVFENSIFLRLRKTQNALQLPVFFFLLLLFCQPYLGLRNCKSAFLILKISQYGGSRQWVQPFSRDRCKNWYKNWYLRFYKTYNHQIWQVGTSNQADAGDVITSRSLDKLNTLYLLYPSAHDQQTLQDGNLSGWAPALKSQDCDHVRSRDKLKSLYLHYQSAYGYQTWQDGKLP